jgi:hypothetical protein
MTAIMALLKAFNLLVIGVIQPYAVQASIDRRRQFVADQVAAMDRKEIFAMDVCSVCLSGMTVKNSRATPCGHVFHETCLITWLTENVTCPMCRCVIRRANDDKATWAGMVGNEILLAQQQQEQELRANLIRAAIEQQQVNQHFCNCSFSLHPTGSMQRYSGNYVSSLHRRSNGMHPIQPWSIVEGQTRRNLVRRHTALLPVKCLTYYTKYRAVLSDC